MYTDGSCLGNPGAGGWAALLIWGNKNKQICGNVKYTTNNRMELQAVIEGLKAIKNKKYQIYIITDSQYIKNGITKWINKWMENNWLLSSKKEVKNKDLWQMLYSLAKQHSIKWKWVKAHSNIKYNEQVDALARKMAKKTQN